MVAQTSYTKTMRQAIAGMLAHDFGPADTESFIVSGLEDGAPSPDVEIPFGTFVRSLGTDISANPGGAADYQRAIITNEGMHNSTGLVGVTLRQLMQDDAIHQIPGQSHTKSGETTFVVSNGYVFVDLFWDSNASAVPDTQVYIDDNGRVHGDADTDQNSPVEGAVFKTAADPSGDVDAPNVVLIKVNIIQPATVPAP